MTPPSRRLPRPGSRRRGPLSCTYFTNGAHGFGMGAAGLLSDSWIDLLDRWPRARGLLERGTPLRRRRRYRPGMAVAAFQARGERRYPDRRLMFRPVPHPTSTSPKSDCGTFNSPAEAGELSESLPLKESRHAGSNMLGWSVCPE